MIVLVGALVVALGALAAWWFAPFGETAEAGEPVPLGSSVFSDLEGHPTVDREIDVRLPHGSLTFTVGRPLDSLPHGLALADRGELDDGDLHAPRGHEFVVLEWRPTVSRLAQGLEGTPGAGAPEDDAVEIALRAGDVRAELDTDGEDRQDVGWSGHRGGAAVALDGDDVDDAVLEVTFDGLTQTVSLADGSVDAGAAAPLYGWDPVATSYARPGCGGSVTLPPGFETDDVVCQAEPVVSPWLPDEGWAEGGGTWTLVDVTTVVIDRLVREGDDDSPWSAEVVAHAEDVDGAAPLAPLRLVLPEDSETYGTEGTGVLVFPSPARPETLTMTQELRLTRDLGGGGGPLSMRVDFTLDLAPYLPTPEQP